MILIGWRRLGVVTIVVAASAAGCGNPGPREGDLQPLIPIGRTQGDLTDPPIVEETPGVLRQVGLFMMIVSADFNTGVMREVDPGVELIVEEPTGLTGEDRLIIARAQDHLLDAMISALENAPGVIAGPDKSYMYDIQAERSENQR